ncbi:GNA1162 family protein [uncultured Bacteroides sp.]|uniref:GNA1162 family protein n=1 Tax=uncultured Bacteroides sp. TaxID=162156 RepID=UPI002AA94154|nr:GNA1162 family protein [uncultured Bacteroides sp.]
MKKYIYFAFIAMLLASCGSSTNFTRGKSYPKMYTDKPVTILVMPPINKTVNVEAKEYFYTSMMVPLCEKGYYVISPFLAMDLLKSESAYDSELFLDGNLASFKNVFGADVALFTVINEWSKSTMGNTITVDIEYILKSTTTNEVLFSRKGRLNVNTSINSGNSAGLLGALVDMAASAINTALTDKVIAARRCNNFVLHDLPDGKYSPMFDKDQNVGAGGANFSGTVSQ